MPVLLATALACFLALVVPAAQAQNVGDPDAARLVVKCQKAVGKAERVFASAALANAKKCVDAVFSCVQTKPGDAPCATKAATTCDKQFLRTDQAAIKLRASIGKACGAGALPFDLLASPAALDVDVLTSMCTPFGVSTIDTLEDYVECIFRLATCHVDDLVETGTPRATVLLATVGRDLREPFCPTPAPTSTVVATVTPTRTTTPVVPTPTPTITVTTTPTPMITATSLTPTPTQSITPTPTETATATATPIATVTATPIATTSVTPTATATPTVFNYAFVTSTTHTGNLGGLPGADAICAARASEAGLPGSYVAWLSTSTVDAVDRLGGARGFIRPDGAPFADLPTELTANEVWNALHLDETGADVGGDLVWTGTAKNGTVSGSATCSDWASTSGSGRIGNSQGGPATWTDASSSPSCGQPHRLYCFGTSLTPPALGPTVESAKIAFLSTNTLQPSTSPGVAGADAMCAADASGAGLTGTFRALLATSGASAVSRVTLAARYVRPDGTFIATGSALAAGGALTSGIWQRANGAYLASFSDVAWTGATTPSVAGTVSSTCGNFASATGAGFFGRATLADGTWWHDAATTSACTQGHHVYCLQQ